MNTYRTIDLSSWPRRKHFEFYRTFDAPCFNLAAKVEAAPLQAFAKANGESFFLLALYAILRAANAVPQFRQRMLGEEVIEFERIAVMTPIMAETESFHQIWCEYAPDYPAFKAEAAPLIEQAKTCVPAPFVDHGEDFLCASCVPWLHFESISQAEYHFNQTIPILAWGKLKEGVIPVSVKLNHCFVDGLHVARFFASLEEGFTGPKTLFRAD